MRQLILNNSHYVAGSGNQFVLNLPSTIEFNQGDKVALGGVSIYNSTYNITAARGNNTLSLTWPSWTNTPAQLAGSATNVSVQTGFGTGVSSGGRTFNAVLGIPAGVSVGQVIANSLVLPTGTTITAINNTAISLSNAFIATTTTTTLFQITIPGAPASTASSIYAPYTPPTPLTIPDGFYNLQQINGLIQSYMFAQGLYMIQNGNPVYFISITANTPTYGSQINFTELPTTSQAAAQGLTTPPASVFTLNANGGTTTVGSSSRVGLQSFATVSSMNGIPTITFTSTFGSLIGFSGGTFSALTGTGAIFDDSKPIATRPVYSWLTPTISPINSYIVTCNLINSPYSIPSNIFYTIPLTVSLSNIMVINPSEFIWNEIAPNKYNQVVITFYDQLFNKITLNDTQMTMALAIKTGASAIRTAKL